MTDAILGGSTLVPTLDLPLDEASVAWINAHGTGYPHAGVFARVASLLEPNLLERHLTQSGYQLLDPEGEPADPDSLGQPMVSAWDGGRIALWPRLRGRDGVEDIRMGAGSWDEAGAWIIDMSEAAVVVRHPDVLNYRYAPAEISTQNLAEVHPLPGDGTIMSLRGVGLDQICSMEETTREGLEAMGFYSAFDVLYSTPRSYLSTTHAIPLTPDLLGQEVAFIAEVTDVRRPAPGTKQPTSITVRDCADGTRVVLAFFRGHWTAAALHPGIVCVVVGKLESYRGAWQILEPNVDIIRPQDAFDPHVKVLGIYAQSAKNKVTTWDMRRVAKNAAARLPQIFDPIPQAILDRHGFIERTAAIRALHSPDSLDQADAARRRLAFEEIFRWQVVIAMTRHSERAHPGRVMDAPGRYIESMLAAKPYSPTQAQQRVLGEILADMKAPVPMHRLLQGEVGSGKAQPLDSLVLTPRGFIQMGDIRVGDEVMTPEGVPSTVQGVFPQGVRPVYKVHFSDGSVVRADESHLWEVSTTVQRWRGSPPSILTTEQIRDGLRTANGSPKWYVETIKPFDFDGAECPPIDPYLMGALLGDGTLGSKPGQGPMSASLTTADVEMIDFVRLCVPDGIDLSIKVDKRRERLFSVSFIQKTLPPLDSADCKLEDIYNLHLRGYSNREMSRVFGIPRERIAKLAGDGYSDRRGKRNYVNATLKELGLWGTRSATKFIPDIYLHQSYENRLSLFRGLMDTDGTCNKNGHQVSFSTVSPRLAHDVEWLARSLGAKAQSRLCVRKSGLSYHVSIHMPDGVNPFRLQRKASRVKARSAYKNPVRGITSVEFDGYEDTQCIYIDDPRHLYITDNFTVTHNTLVLACAMAQAVESGVQAALMVPLDDLARQHYDELRAELPDSIRIELIAKGVSPAKAKKIREDCACGEVNILVGTSSLITPKTTYANLGLCVIDEQHRFGVEQRRTFSDKGRASGLTPDVLVVTATPAPRTAQLTMFGDLDISIIDQMPPGRSPIATWREDILPITTMQNHIEAGHQVFVISPSVKASKTKHSPGVEALAQTVEANLPNARVGFVHGGLVAADKKATLDAFRRGELDILVSTTVIEVGVNVPNSTLIVMTGAENFGITQLHQLRGRVGRGQWPGECVLVPGKEWEHLSDETRMRLDAVINSTNGFELAQIDLELRGGGSLSGTHQEGKASDLRIADLLRDLDLIEIARSEAVALVESDPQLRTYPSLRGEMEGFIGEDGVKWLETL